jgi:ribosomal protein L34E
MRVYDSETRKYVVGCGELRVRIAFKTDKSFHFLLLSIDNKDNECGLCWLEVSANILTALLRRIKPDEIPMLIKNLKNQRCKYGTQSCPNATSKAIEETFKTKEDKDRRLSLSYF